MGQASGKDQRHVMDHMASTNNDNKPSIKLIGRAVIKVVPSKVHLLARPPDLMLTLLISINPRTHTSHNKILTTMSMARLIAAADAGNSICALASVYKRIVTRAKVGGLLGPNI